jgi:hypothetical protein
LPQSGKKRGGHFAASPQEKNNRECRKKFMYWLFRPLRNTPKKEALKQPLQICQFQKIVLLLQTDNSIIYYVQFSKGNRHIVRDL